MVKNWLWSWRRARSAKNIWAALTSFCTCLCRRCILVSLSVWASCSIRLCSDVRAYADTGVTGVCTWICGQSTNLDLISFWNDWSSEGLRCSSEYSVLVKRNELLSAYAAVIFLFVNALALAELIEMWNVSYRLYLYLSNIAVQLSRDRPFSRGQRLQCWSLLKMWEERRHSLMLLSKQNFKISRISCVRLKAN